MGYRSYGEVIDRIIARSPSIPDGWTRCPRCDGRGIVVKVETRLAKQIFRMAAGLPMSYGIPCEECDSRGFVMVADYPNDARSAKELSSPPVQKRDS